MDWLLPGTAVRDFKSAVTFLLVLDQSRCEFIESLNLFVKLTVLRCQLGQLLYHWLFIETGVVFCKEQLIPITQSLQFGRYRSWTFSSSYSSNIYITPLR